MEAGPLRAGSFLSAPHPGATMPNANLLVPGTGGVTLRDSLGQDIGYPVRMRLGVALGQLLGMSPERLAELLSMEHRPGQWAPVKTTLVPGLSLLPNQVIAAAYNQVPRSFNHFLYDWRSDMRYSAEQLLLYLQQRRPSGGRWNLVGHSQGGLLIVLASKLLPEPEHFAELVASVTLVAAPLAGTVNAAAGLLNGDQMGTAASPVFREILRTWPALYQMLPSWPAVVEGGAVAPPDLQLTSPRGWVPHPGISTDFLERALKVQALLRDPFAWMRGDVRVTVLMARNRPTALFLPRVNGALPSPLGPLAPQDATPGDTLVPVDETLRWGGPALTPFVQLFDGNTNEHAFLLDDPVVGRRIRTLIRR